VSSDIIIITGTAIHDGPITVRAKIVDAGAEAHVPITQADITSITYSIEEQADYAWNRSEVTGHQDQTVAVASCVFDALQSDSVMADYNFKHTIPSSVNSPFPNPAKLYWIYYKFTPVSGEPFIVAAQVRTES